ncbi:hypothetical protein D1BOALGB6SA_4964 [Olavius sp. associated proteobacterium Delta 1]|nr:hypothetical protein D1BOALGB6SA_4964 [Olavius sp. associated proteobacterium Delta 1]
MIIKIPSTKIQITNNLQIPMTQAGSESPQGGSFGLNSVRMKLIRENQID